eukprot:gnl/MRDRNA2_/MRDRNA2_57749_c0_seq1.p1 gnl/MRDRNA2_/MRDRNA2_57749_c0~~gnl/MRDRNA2_/MRDRNA2_57749_c0_seq1.p1  ORF type:complete len:258 (-),score=26.09 gnl/MRDRNA2_/MRDRNA2_57749_c0_seq1:132-905(-)
MSGHGHGHIGHTSRERGLGGQGSRPVTLPPHLNDMPLSGHILTFIFTAVTDLAFVPPLIVMSKYRRHFEIYVGCVMVVSAFCYNFLDAANRGDADYKSWTLIIPEEDWHRISNVSSTTYIMLLIIHLAHLKDADLNIILRYAAASTVVLAQVKDGFWMQETQWTVVVVFVAVALLVLRYVMTGEIPVYFTAENASRCGIIGSLAGISFYYGLDDDHDQFRFAHGLSHLFSGVALTFLWNLIPRPKRKEDLMMRSDYV